MWGRGRDILQDVWRGRDILQDVRRRRDILQDVGEGRHTARCGEGEVQTASWAEMRKAQILIGKPERRHDFGDLKANGMTKTYFNVARVL